MRIVLPVVGSLMLLAGVPAFEVVRVVAILLVQITAGVLIWGVVDPRSSKSMPLMIGAGSTIGFCASTLLHQLLLTTPIARIAWLLPLIGVLVFLFFKRKQNDFEATSELQFGLKTFAPILVLFTTIGLGDQWWWIFPIVFLSGALVIANFLHKNIFKAVFILLPFAVLFSVLLRKMNYLWWIMTNDIPFLESLAYSVNRWGPRKNITAVGTEISYHWFALAWSGMTTQLSGAQSWTVLTIMLPIVVCMTIGLLLWGIIYETTTSRILATIGAASVLLLRDVVSVTSPTHMFSFTIMFVLVLMMKRWLEIHTITFQAAVTAAVLLFCLFGSKVSTGATFSAGAGLMILISSNLKLRIRFAALISAGVAVLLSYVFFFGSGPLGGGHQLKLGFSNVGGLILVDRVLGGGPLHFVLELFTQSLYFFPELAGVLLISVFRSYVLVNTFQKYLVLSIASGFILARFLDGGGTESYFMHVTFPIATILIIVTLHAVWKVPSFALSCKQITFILATGFLLGFVRRWITQVVISHRSNSVIERSLPFIMLYAVAFGIAIFYSRHFSSSTRRFLFILSFCLLLASSISGEQVQRRYSFAKSTFNATSGNGLEFVKWNHLTGSPDQTAAIRWITGNVPRNDVVATNRRCQQIDFCGYPKWYLLSALAKRQLLLEGNSTGLPNDDPLVEGRKILSEEFVISPNKAMANRLYELGVRWHYVELNFIETPSGWEPLDLAQKRTWEPWAKIVFKNDTSVVLQLLPPAN
jgi:hypothetical protein